jgi:hypothetical protein
MQNSLVLPHLPLPFYMLPACPCRLSPTPPHPPPPRPTPFPGEPAQLKQSRKNSKRNACPHRHCCTCTAAQRSNAPLAAPQPVQPGRHPPVHDSKSSHASQDPHANHHPHRHHRHPALLAEPTAAVAAAAGRVTAAQCGRPWAVAAGEGGAGAWAAARRRGGGTGGGHPRHCTGGRGGGG